MTTLDRIKELCKKNGISIQKLEQDLNFSNGSISKTNEKVQAERIRMISDYFNVSMEYLMTGKEKEFPEFEPEHLEMIMLYSKLNEEQKRTVMTFLRSLAPRD